jgi:acyl carrier protein
MRINFAQRMNMHPVVNHSKLIERHFEALCPPINSPLSAKVPGTPCVMDLELVLKEVETILHPNLQAYIGRSHHDGTSLVYLAPRTENDLTILLEFDMSKLSDCLRKVVDGFLLPSNFIALEMPFPRDGLGLVDEKRLDELVQAQKSTTLAASSETEEKIRRAFSAVLNFDIEEISHDSDFFELGGESLSAGQLLSILRRDFQVRIPVDQLFTSSKVHELCKLVDELVALDSEEPATDVGSMVGSTKTYSSTNPLVLFVHLLPMVVFYPMKQAFKWIVLMYMLAWISKVWSEPNIPSRFVALVFSLFASRLATQVVAPICGICFKWLIIGRYKEGVYPMWGVYHTRWWIVEKVLTICGKVCFFRLHP